MIGNAEVRLAKLQTLRPQVATLAPRIGATTLLVEPDAPRRKSQPGAEWYNTRRWRKLAAEIKLRDRSVCQQTGVTLTGKCPAPNSPVVDHKIPHRGNPDLFWDASNLQTVSKGWHDRVKQSLERRGEI